MEEYDWPAKSPDLIAKPGLLADIKAGSHSRSDTLVSEWEQIPTARFQNFVEKPESRGIWRLL